MLSSNPPDPRTDEQIAREDAAYNAAYASMRWDSRGWQQALLAAIPAILAAADAVGVPSVVPDQPEPDATSDVTSVGQNETQTALDVTSVPDRPEPWLCVRCGGQITLGDAAIANYGEQWVHLGCPTPVDDASRSGGNIQQMSDPYRGVVPDPTPEPPEGWTKRTEYRTQGYGTLTSNGAMGHTGLIGDIDFRQEQRTVHEGPWGAWPAVTTDPETTP